MVKIPLKKVKRPVVNKIEMNETAVETKVNENYQISKEPTVVLNFSQEKPVIEDGSLHSNIKLTRENLSNFSKTYIENVVKYSESKPTRKVSGSGPRPPPPSSK